MIQVQARPDHIESLSKASPLAALEELIWNALDADAREVKVDLVVNELQAVVAIRVSDDGSGVDVAHADGNFGSLGGSWKRDAQETAGGHRRLHGHQGRGRFKAFALGGRVEWRTTVRDGDGALKSFVLVGDSARPGEFELIEQSSPGVAPGTEVFITEIRANSDSLKETAEVVQSLAERFAHYLKNYPGVNIYFGGIPVTALLVQKRLTNYRLKVGESGAEARLEVLEWKRKFSGSGKIVFSGPDGFRLHEMSAGVRAGEAAFTAYLVAARFPALAEENSLLMEELNPEVRAYIEAAKKVLKAHFATLSEQPDPEFVNEWKPRIEGLSEPQRRLLLQLLKHSLKVRRRGRRGGAEAAAGRESAT